MNRIYKMKGETLDVLHFVTPEIVFIPSAFCF
jgi:hypothetical protein